MRSALCVLGVLAVLAGQGDRRPAAAAEARHLDLPQGRTSLAEIGIYRIGYQHYGKAPVDMPASWSGDFTDDAGIAFKPVAHDGGGGARTRVARGAVALLGKAVVRVPPEDGAACGVEAGHDVRALLLVGTALVSDEVGPATRDDRRSVADADGCLPERLRRPVRHRLRGDGVALGSEPLGPVIGCRTGRGHVECHYCEKYRSIG